MSSPISNSNEGSPLLDSEDGVGQQRSKASIHRLLPVFALAQIAAYMVNTVRMNWAITLVCRQVHGKKLFDNDPVCQTDSIQSKVSEYTALCSLAGGILGLYMLPRIAEWSDRIGRKAAIGVFLFGDMLAIASMAITLFIWDQAGYRSIIVAYIITGAFGTASLINVLMSSYTADCVEPKYRAQAMGYVTACTLVGKASGPYLSSSLVRTTGELFATLLCALALDCLGAVILLFVPESLSLETKERAESSARSGPTEVTVGSVFSAFNIFGPIASIWSIAKNQPGRACKNILVLVSIDLIYELIIAGRAGIAALYPQMRFGWTSIELGYLQSATALMRIGLLVVIIPNAMSLIRRKLYQEEECEGLSHTELFIMRFGNCLEVLGYSGYGLSVNVVMYIVSSFVATSGVIAKPTVQSALLNLVPKEQIGEFLGAKGVLDGLTSIAFSSIGLSFYSFTVTRWPELIFYLSAFGYFIVILLTFRIKP